MSKLIIIDGNSLINRAYYAIQRPMITSEGFYTQGIYGFLSMLFKLRRDYEPTHMIVTFDRKAPTFRHIEYPDYKAGRHRMPEELAMEMPVLKEILDAMGIYRFEEDGWEADDIIGTTAKMAEAEGMESFIITGDRDALQLATELTKVVITKKGITEFKLYDDAAMIEEYGFDHEQFIDYKGLRGDSSDNIPGIPGVGEKTAVKLIRQFGSIENMLEHTDEIEGAKLREKIEDGANIALMSKRLATIVTDVPTDYSVDDLKIKEEDSERLRELYTKLEFRKYLSMLDKKASAKESSDPDRMPVFGASSKDGDYEDQEAEEHELIYGSESLIANLSGSVFIDIVSDNSHTHKPVIECVQICRDGKCYVATNMDIAVFDKAELRLSGFELQKIYYIFERWGVDTSNMISEFDISLARYVLRPNARAVDLGFDDKSSQLSMFTNAKEAFGDCIKKFVYMKSESESLKAELKAAELDTILYDIELPLCKILASMEAKGIKLDRAELMASGEELAEKAAELERKIFELSGESFNINSPKQLGTVLFEKLQLPGAKKTKTGYATNADVLDKLAEEHEIVHCVLLYRTVSKLKSTYVDGMLSLVGEDGKLRPHFKQNVTATGRLSCIEPNLQNIPVRDAMGKKLRRAFTADSEEYCLIGADYSQIELRVLAHMSGEKALIQAFNEGHDIHAETASKIFGVPLDQVSPQMRSNAKVVNFGVIYGMSSFGLADELTISRWEAEKYISDYFTKFKAVKKFLDECIASAKERGYAVTLYGRKRSVPEINARQYTVRQFGERLAMNTPIQGTAADIIKLAMIKVYEALAQECPKSKLILQIHDELIIHAERSEAEKVKKLLTDNMSSAAALKTALEVTSEEGNNWYELK